LGASELYLVQEAGTSCGGFNPAVSEALGAEAGTKGAPSNPRGPQPSSALGKEGVTPHPELCCSANVCLEILSKFFGPHGDFSQSKAVGLLPLGPNLLTQILSF
jgi:hypothetical protein